MPLGLDGPSLLLAFAVTVVEMTEVVALIFALGAEGGTLRPAALGAIAGTATVGSLASLVGLELTRLPAPLLLGAAAVVLFLFGLFLFRSTVRTFRRARSPAPPPARARSGSAPFVGGYAAGGIETLETVIVLLAIAAGGHATSAVVGALAGGAVLVALAVAVHERVRRIKPPTLKLAATSALFTFAIFWGGEAAGVAWPGPAGLAELDLLPLFVLLLLLVRALVGWRAALPPPTGRVD